MTAPDPRPSIRALMELAAEAKKAQPGPWTVSAWDNRAPLDLGPHEPIPFGISSGCTRQGEVGHDCNGEDEEDACIVVEFARVHLNHAGKSPNDPENVREWHLSKFMAMSHPDTVRALCEAVMVAREALVNGKTALVGYCLGEISSDDAQHQGVIMAESLVRIDQLVRVE